MHAGPSERPIVGAGLKMYFGYAETVRYLWELAERAGEFADVNVFVLPSFPALPQAQLALAETRVAYGAQDGHWEERGAYTGSVSPAMLRELGCRYVEVGHAERRRDFCEDDDMVGLKAAAAVRCGLVPLVCVGEQERGDDAGAHVLGQARAALAQVPDDAEVVIAYEPVWAIGADATAGGEHVAAVTGALRGALARRGGTTRILYGGSVAPGAAGQVLAAGVDGVFVGRGALVIDDLRQVARELAEAR